MACDDRPVCISAFYLWILGGGKAFILCPGYFLYCHVFPMVSALDYSLLKHVVINDGSVILPTGHVTPAGLLVVLIF